MSVKETLDIFNLWCPICGMRLLEKIIGNCKFIYCEDVHQCEYYKIDIHDFQESVDAFNKFKEFIDREKEKKEISFKSTLLNKTNNQGIEIYTINPNENKLNENKIYNQKTDENDINLVIDLLKDDEKDKSKIEVYREESRYKKVLQKSTISKKRLHREINRNKRFKNREFEKKEKLKREKELKRNKTKKIFKEKYLSLFGEDLLKIENINNKYFSDYEIEIGKLLYKNQQLEVKKEEDNKMKEKIKEEHQKFVRKYEF
ncbi:MAG: hypothetical protein LBT10_08685 [Methanobrevibacter sp.]|nr:hypothetical protein [Methanobrevibacter sp.]